jgi:hypothetical protein
VVKYLVQFGHSSGMYALAVPAEKINLIAFDPGSII